MSFQHFHESYPFQAPFQFNSGSENKPAFNFTATAAPSFNFTNPNANNPQVSRVKVQRTSGMANECDDFYSLSSFECIQEQQNHYQFGADNSNMTQGIFAFVCLSLILI
jgi:hypothetical protein